MIERKLAEKTAGAIDALFGQKLRPEDIAVQKTHQDFEGDFTIVIFPFIRFSKRSPELTAAEIGKYLEESVEEVESFNVIKGFLNLVIKNDYWLKFYYSFNQDTSFGQKMNIEDSPVVVEFSSPNTNKPLHLGHIRNNLLGWSISEILKASGNKVARVNLVNDRGIHICKTMLAWQKWADGKEPAMLGKKGDRYVGDLYVMFEQANRREMQHLMDQGQTEDDAYKNSPLTKEALELLQQWEAGDPETRHLWENMNSWVYEGFDRTYKRMGVSFDKTYYESGTYLFGKELVKEGVDKGIFIRRPDGSVWADLTKYKMDEKLLLRSDGTSVYMTQDLGTAQLRYDDYHPSKLLYVVGNEQNYHFDVLKIILGMLGREWANGITHVSYGMVELPSGKMKSREGTVVDADDLMDEMFNTAKRMTTELGKVEGLTNAEADALFEMIGMGALKYFILKVDPKKNMLFNPEESIDFNGNTGPFIQYTHARICSLARKAAERGIAPEIDQQDGLPGISPKEKQILKILHDFPGVVEEAVTQLSPAVIANYVYDLAKEYNQFYQEIPVMREPDARLASFRLGLSTFTGEIIKKAMGLLGITVPERM
jgi:arginyl-tRNA synthetase